MNEEKCVEGALGETTPFQLREDGVPGPLISRGDPYALRSLVQIDAPADGTTITSPVTVTGEAAVFEATLHWAVVSGTTTISTGVASTDEGQVFAPFRFTIALPPGHYTVQISEDDPSDGAGRPVLTDSRTITTTARASVTSTSSTWTAIRSATCATATSTATASRT